MADEYIAKDYDGGAQATTLTSGFTVGGSTLAVSNGSTFPDGSGGPFVVVVDRGLASEEKFLIDTTTGANGVTFNIQQAGYDGTTAVNHNSGATVEHCLDAYTLKQANRYVNLQTTKGDLVVHTASTTDRLAVGTTGVPLVANSAASAGVNWAELGTAGIADNAVTAAKIASGAVGASELASSAVETAKINDGAVTNAKLGLTELKLRKTSSTVYSATGNTTAFVSWDTEDSDADGFITATSDTITVPSGKDGLYSIVARHTGSVPGSSDSIQAYGFVVNGEVVPDNGDTISNGQTFAQQTGTLYLVAGDTLKVRLQIYVASSSNTVTLTGSRLWMTRIMD